MRGKKREICAMDDDLLTCHFRVLLPMQKVAQVQPLLRQGWFWSWDVPAT